MSFTLVPSADGTKADLQVSGSTVLTAHSDGRLLAANSPSVTDDSKRLTTTELLRDLTLGVDQTWQNVSASRAASTTYYNTTGKPICLGIYVIGNASSNALVTATINGVAMEILATVATAYTTATGFVVIPAGCSYSLAMTAVWSFKWFELR